VAKASFYQHFASKEEQGTAYLQESEDRWRSALQGVWASTSDPRGRILALFDFLQQWKELYGHRGCAFLNISAEFIEPASSLRRMVDRHADFFRETIRSLVADYVRARQGRDGETEQLSVALYILFQGALVSIPQLDASVVIEAARKTATQLLDH
jgi:AcrR family transcriptional regulator